MPVKPTGASTGITGVTDDSDRATLAAKNQANMLADGEAGRENAAENTQKITQGATLALEALLIAAECVPYVGAGVAAADVAKTGVEAGLKATEVAVEEAAKVAAEEAAKAAAEEAAKVAAEKATEAATKEVAKAAGGEVAKEGGEQAGKAVATETGKAVGEKAGKTVAEKSGEAVGEKAVEAVAKKPAEAVVTKGGKKAAAGGVDTQATALKEAREVKAAGDAAKQADVTQKVTDAGAKGGVKGARQEGKELVKEAGKAGRETFKSTRQSYHEAKAALDEAKKAGTGVKEAQEALTKAEAAWKVEQEAAKQGTAQITKTIEPAKVVISLGGQGVAAIQRGDEEAVVKTGISAAEAGGKAIVGQAAKNKA